MHLLLGLASQANLAAITSRHTCTEGYHLILVSTDIQNSFRKKHTGLTILLSLTLSGSAIAEPHLFSDDGFKDTVDTHNRRSFSLMRWPSDCSFCLEELKYSEQFSSGSLVLVSADRADYAEETQQALAQNGLANDENWRFSGDFSKRLHYCISPNWYEELPRAYPYSARHKRISRNGTPSKKLLKKIIAGSKHIE